ncbi:MAG: hypothetical protein WCK59_00440 [Candidatus Falkowbacteria bacterium]
MKKLFIVLALAIFLAVPLSASYAFEVKVDNSVKLNKEEIADGNVYASCSDMTIDGTVNGDLIALCKNITVNGTVNGDLIAFSNNITVNGEIKGSARIAGTNLNINGQIDHNVNAFGTEINLSPNSKVGWDVLIAGVNGVFNGIISGNLHGYISAAKISGKIGKNINLKINPESTSSGQGGLLITKDAVVAGGLTYSANQVAKIESPSSIVGAIVRQEVKNKEASPVAALSKIFYKLAALFLIGLVILSLNKKVIYKASNNLEKKYWQSALIGLVILIAAPLVIIFFIFTVIGIPLSLMLLATYLIALFLSIIVSSFFVGELLFKRIFKKTLNIFLVLIIGLLIFVLAAAIPVVGGLITLLFIIYGLGAIFLTIKNHQYD